MSYPLTEHEHSLAGAARFAGARAVLLAATTLLLVAAAPAQLSPNLSMGDGDFYDSDW
jgi:hypothetical protein